MSASANPTFERGGPADEVPWPCRARSTSWHPQRRGGWFSWRSASAGAGATRDVVLQRVRDRLGGSFQDVRGTLVPTRRSGDVA